jgi:hypothetical protein
MFGKGWLGREWGKRGLTISFSCSALSLRISGLRNYWWGDQFMGR